MVNRKLLYFSKKYWQRKRRVMIFIDIANIIYSQRDLGWEIDYKRLIKFFKKMANLVGIFVYSGIIDENKGQQNFFAMLKRIGYTVKTKKVKFITQRDGTVFRKGNCDVDLAVDMVSLCDLYDTAILMSGDSDFVAAVNFAKAKGKEVLVFSTKGHISRELIETADKYFNLKKFRRWFERRSLLKSKKPS